MRRATGILVALVFWVAACGRAGPPATASPTPRVESTEPLLLATDTAAAPPPTAASATEAPATEAPPTAPAPTPTSFDQGLTARLGTPDPNPNCPEHYPWFFDNPAPECAAFILNTWTVWQPFERGLMVWTQERGQTRVLLDDGSPFKPYHFVSDPLGLPLPGPDPAIVPPEGLFQPELGFALYWRGLVPGTEWVREALGWATAPETAYSAFWQCSTATGPAARCYFNGPRDELIALTTGGPQYWTYVQRAVR